MIPTLPTPGRPHLLMSPRGALEHSEKPKTSARDEGVLGRKSRLILPYMLSKGLPLDLERSMPPATQVGADTRLENMKSCI